MFHDILEILSYIYSSQEKPSYQTLEALVSRADGKACVKQCAAPMDASVGPLQLASTTEKSDDYYRIIIRVNDDWRIIECNSGIQWIIQKRRGYYSDKPAWKSVSFCRSRKGLRYWTKEKTKERSLALANEFRKLPLWVEL